jgi:hypothetical protein
MRFEAVRRNAVSAFANCGRAVAHVRGSYVPTSGLMHCYKIIFVDRLIRTAEQLGETSPTEGSRACTLRDRRAVQTPFVRGDWRRVNSAREAKIL